MFRTFFSEEVSKVGALVLLLRLLDPPADRGVVDPKLLGRLLERVVHCVLPHLLLEPDQNYSNGDHLSIKLYEVILRLLGLGII